MTMPRGVDVVVVGSGIVGATSAAALATRDASVVLLDKEDGPAREGSGRAQGSLRVQGRHHAEFPLAREALELWAEAAAEGDFEFVVGGNLYIRTTEEELPVLQRLVDEAHRAGLTDVELLEADQTRTVIPCATGPFLGAIWSPIDAACQPATATAHYVGRAERAGVHLGYGVKVTELLEAGGRIAGVHTTAGPIAADAVVVAAGVWTPYLANTVGVTVPVLPVVMSELETEPVKPLLTPTIRAFGFGARQRPSGRTVVSAGLNAKVGHGVSLVDFHGLRYWLPRALAFRKHIKLQLDTPRITEQLRHRSTLATQLIPDTSPEPPVDCPLVDSSLSRLSQLIPAFDGVGVARYWAGLVDLTPDGLPVIDGGAGPEGLTIMTGLCGHGLALGPVLGEIAADLSLTGGTTRPIDPFRLARFTTGSVGHPEVTI
jgi:sarcosine oxidase, subunit beta